MGHEDGSGLEGLHLSAVPLVDLPLGEDDHGAAVLQTVHGLVEAGHAEVVLVHLNAVHPAEEEGHEAVLIEVLGDQTVGTPPRKGGKDRDGVEEGGVVGRDKDTALGAFPAHVDDLGTDPDEARDEARDLNEIVPEVGKGAFLGRCCRFFGVRMLQGDHLAGGFVLETMIDCIIAYICCKIK